MRRLFIGILALTCLRAQTMRDRVLPGPTRHIAGRVFDTEGKPLANARIDYSNNHQQEHATDANGRFEIDTTAPALVVRKTGYQSEFLQPAETGAEVRITLQKVSASRAFPTCSSGGRYVGIEEADALFQFVKSPKLKVSRQGRDADYTARSYYVLTEHGRKAILHGSGSMWSLGTPEDGDVWRSVKYEEAVYVAGRFTVIDGRGEFSNGNKWRYLGKFGESASYSDVDQVTARILDAFLNGACLKPTLRR